VNGLGLDLDGGAEVEVCAEVVGSQIGKQVAEDLRVLLVQLSVGPCEHLMKV